MLRILFYPIQVNILCYRHLKTGKHSNIDAMLLGGVTDLGECSAAVLGQGKLCH